ncbi:hypothetical protein [Streptomyces sp. MMG1121]|uniref:hypothetical protein n=1 Tax=Streptomyces sp. MMG1121 TaxID=1415544 RepID=UPI0006AF6191|nr:hypothetical protein [Streptomyces sp. MMG1121]
MPTPYDLLVLLAVSPACHAWAVRSGCRTQQLVHARWEDSPDVRTTPAGEPESRRARLLRPGERPVRGIAVSDGPPDRAGSGLRAHGPRPWQGR